MTSPVKMGNVSRNHGSAIMRMIVGTGLMKWDAIIEHAIIPNSHVDPVSASPATGSVMASQTVRMAPMKSLKSVEKVCFSFYLFSSSFSTCLVKQTIINAVLNS